MTLLVGIAVVLLLLLQVALLRSQRPSRLVAYLALQEYWSASRWERYRARERIPFLDSFPDELSEEDYRSMNAAVSSLSDLEFILERRYASARDVMSTSHVEILRSCYATKEWRVFREASMAGRYGRRVDRLEQRAREFHYLRRRHRGSGVVWDGPDGPVDVVLPYKESGITWWAMMLIRMKWLFRALR